MTCLLSQEWFTDCKQNYLLVIFERCVDFDVTHEQSLNKVEILMYTNVLETQVE